MDAGWMHRRIKNDCKRSMHLQPSERLRRILQNLPDHEAHCSLVSAKVLPISMEVRMPIVEK
jgi:hypothetical protein